MLSPAARHLLAALHEREGQDRALLARLSDPDWVAVADLAVRQRVAPLLYSRADLPIPAAVRATLRARADYAVRRALQLQAALRDLAARVAPLGIDLVALKGMHLAMAVYPSAALREMGDIDVLVPEARVREVYETARAAGYAPVPQVSHLSHELAMQVSHHLPALRAGVVGLEVHHGLTPPNSATTIPVGAVLQRAQLIRKDWQVRGLAPEDLVLHLCVHAAGNHELQIDLRPLCDLQAVVLKFGTTLDWDIIVSRAQEWGCQRLVGLMVMLTHRNLGVAVPAEVVAYFSAQVPEEMKQAALHGLTDDLQLMQGRSVEAARLVGATGWREWWQRGWRRVALPPQELGVAYAGAERGGWRRWQALVRRVVYVIRRHGPWVLRVKWQREEGLRSAVHRRNALTAWLRGDARRG